MLERPGRDQRFIERRDFFLQIVLVLRNFASQMSDLRLHDEAEHANDGKGKHHHGNDGRHPAKKKTPQAPDRGRQHKGEQNGYGERFEDDAAQIEHGKHETHDDEAACYTDD